MYEMVMFRHPFYTIDENITHYKLEKRIVEQPFVPITGTFSQKLATIVGKMLDKNPEERPSLETIINASKSMLETF